jgi:hypothetical protein
MVGLFSLPLHLYLEGLGTVVEFLGYILVPLLFFGGLLSPTLLTLFIVLGLAYGGFLSVGAILLQEMTYGRYPRSRDLLALLAYGMLESIGYRQLLLFYRVEGILKFLVGSHRWEKVAHKGEAMSSRAIELTPAPAHASVGEAA